MLHRGGPWAAWLSMHHSHWGKPTWCVDKRELVRLADAYSLLFVPLTTLKCSPICGVPAQRLVIYGSLFVWSFFFFPSPPVSLIVWPTEQLLTDPEEIGPFGSIVKHVSASNPSSSGFDRENAMSYIQTHVCALLENTLTVDERARSVWTPPTPWNSPQGRNLCCSVRGRPE